MVESSKVRAQDVAVTNEAFTVVLTDGRTISVPLVSYPRLTHATPEERSLWRLTGDRLGFIGRTSMRT